MLHLYFILRGTEGKEEEEKKKKKKSTSLGSEPIFKAGMSSVNLTYTARCCHSHSLHSQGIMIHHPEVGTG